MSEHDAFLLAIIENPADDGPRLVYADWLEERGDPRGEFIRVQIERANLEAQWEDLACSECGGQHPAFQCPLFCENRLEPLLRRERELLQSPVAGGNKWHRDYWFYPFDELGVGVPGSFGSHWRRLFEWEYRRGFVEQVSCNWSVWQGGRCDNTPHCRNGQESRGAFGMRMCYRCNGSGSVARHGKAILAAHPIRKVNLTDWPEGFFVGVRDGCFYYADEDGEHNTRIPAYAAEISHRPMLLRCLEHQAVRLGAAPGIEFSVAARPTDAADVMNEAMRHAFGPVEGERV